MAIPEILLKSMRLPFLKPNPFAVDAWFDRSCTLTFALPKDQISAELPDCLTPDTFEDRWGFVAVAVVQTRRLRPSGFPKFLGSDFILVGYRYFVRYKSVSGQTLRGLYILRSETDKARMEWLGNLLTRYRYVRTDIQLTESVNQLRVESSQTGLLIELQLPVAPPAILPEQSPFHSWSEARRFSGPLPFTFSTDREQNRVSIVEGVRSHWQPQPVRVLRHQIPFLQQPRFQNARLANAFVVQNVPYHWKAGRVEDWPPS